MKKIITIYFFKNKKKIVKNRKHGQNCKTIKMVKIIKMPKCS